MMRSSFPPEQKHLRQNTGFISTGVGRILSGLVCHQTQEGGNRVLVTQHPGSAPASPELLCCNHVAAAMSPAAVPEPLPNRGSQLGNCPTESDIRNIEFSRKLCQRVRPQPRRSDVVDRTVRASGVFQASAKVPRDRSML